MSTSNGYRLVSAKAGTMEGYAQPERSAAEQQRKKLSDTMFNDLKSVKNL